MWDVVTGRQLHILNCRLTNSSRIFSPNDEYLVGFDGFHAIIWDTSTGKKVYTLRGHTGSVSSAMFSQDGRQVITASSDRSARIWDAINGQEIFVLEGHKSPVFSAEFSPDGDHVVTFSNDGIWKIWIVSYQNLLKLLKEDDHYSRVRRLSEEECLRYGL
jgi:WD40 repeat protein